VLASIKYHGVLRGLMVGAVVTIVSVLFAHLAVRAAVLLRGADLDARHRRGLVLTVALSGLLGHGDPHGCRVGADRARGADRVREKSLRGSVVFRGR